MECFICCRQVPDDLDLDPDNTDPKLTQLQVICKLLGISISTIENPSCTYFCTKCSGQIDQVEDLFKDLEEIQSRLELIKKEFEKELIGSHKLSEIKRNQFNLRSKIVKGIGQHNKSSPIISDEVAIKVETDYQDNYNYGGQDDLGLEDPPVDIVYGDDNDDERDDIETSAYDPTKRPIKKLKINLEQVGEDTKKTTNNNIKNKTRKSKEKIHLDNDIRINCFKQNNRLMAKCPICSQILRACDLIVHQRKHTGEKPFRCKFRDCNKRFPSAYNLRIHQSVHGIGRYTVMCQFCSKSMVKSSLPLHIARCHPNQDQDQGQGSSKLSVESGQNHLCHICSDNFSSVLVLHAHIRAKHTQHKCAYSADCNKVFNSYNGLASHLVTVHTKDYPFYCTQCDVRKGFLKKYDLDHHTVIVHEGQRPYLCSSCPKSYLAKQALDHHVLKKHTENPNFKIRCHICGKGFIETQKLKSHLVCCEKFKDVETPHECSYCLQKFRTYGTLKSHRIRKHKEEMAREKKKSESEEEEETSNSNSNFD